MSEDGATTPYPPSVPLRIVLPVLLVCVYAPYSWLLWIDYPWNEYRLTWLAQWPLLPGLVPGLLISSGVGIMVFAGMFTVAFVVALVLFGTRSRPALVMAALIAIGISIPFALLTYRFFLA